MKKFFKEFKEFINKGNVFDMAVGIIIGAAFKDIVTSLVNNIISPIIGIVFKADFNDLKLVLKKAETEMVDGVLTEVPEVALKYGEFITGVINFLILAFVVFLLVKFVNAVMALGKKKEVEVPQEPTTKKCPHCCSEIAIEATRCPHCTSEL